MFKQIWPCPAKEITQSTCSELLMCCGGQTTFKTFWVERYFDLPTESDAQIARDKDRAETALKRSDDRRAAMFAP